MRAESEFEVNEVASSIGCDDWERWRVELVAVYEDFDARGVDSGKCDVNPPGCSRRSRSLKVKRVFSNKDLCYVDITINRSIVSSFDRYIIRVGSKAVETMVRDKRNFI